MKQNYNMNSKLLLGCYRIRSTSSSSSGDYEDSELNVEGSASSGPSSSPAVAGKGEQSFGQPQLGTTQEPSAAQAEPSATAPPTAPQPETTVPASGEETAPQAPAAWNFAHVS